ncbi:hypothetical protein L0128_11470, partial [candidate division KSB1 bacterium]|nr:hypothetical protein [candidate division KSB1 bacterium]
MRLHHFMLLVIFVLTANIYRSSLGVDIPVIEKLLKVKSGLSSTAIAEMMIRQQLEEIGSGGGLAS